MTRKLTQQYNGIVCFEIKWRLHVQDDLKADIQNSKKAQQQPITPIGEPVIHNDYPFSSTKITFELKAGEYELTLHDVTAPITHIDMCSSKNFKLIPDLVNKNQPIPTQVIT